MRQLTTAIALLTAVLTLLLAGCGPGPVTQVIAAQVAISEDGAILFSTPHPTMWYVGNDMESLIAVEHISEISSIWNVGAPGQWYYGGSEYVPTLTGVDLESSVTRVDIAAKQARKVVTSSNASRFVVLSEQYVLSITAVDDNDFDILDPESRRHRTEFNLFRLKDPVAPIMTTTVDHVTRSGNACLVEDRIYIHGTRIVHGEAERGCLLVFDINDNNFRRLIDIEPCSARESISVSKDQKWLLLAGPNLIEVRSLPDLTVAHAFRNKSLSRPTGGTLNDDGSMLAIFGDALEVFNLKNMERRLVDPFYSAAIRDDKDVFVGVRDPDQQIYGGGGFPESHMVRRAAFIHGGERLIAISACGDIRAWDVDTWKKVIDCKLIRSGDNMTLEKVLN